MTPSLGAFLSSIILAVLIVIIPISAALVFVSTSDKIVTIIEKTGFVKNPVFSCFFRNSFRQLVLSQIAFS